MYLIKNKKNNKVVNYIDSKYFDMFTFYHINLKRNYPDTPIDDYEVIEENNQETIKEIQTSAEVYVDENKKYKFVKTQVKPNYEAQIDKIQQLQCQIQYLQKQINDIKAKLG